MTTEKLIYVDDTLPGITRKGAGRGWAYYDPKGHLIEDRAEKKRLNAIALPPAYTDEWFCPAPNGHILATGYDDKGRKQYRYHPDFREMRENEKFDSCVAFGSLLPLVRRRVERDLATEGMNRERAVASVIRLLDLGFLRVGNDQYAKRNKSYGATTLRRKHVAIEDDGVHLTYRGKSGKDQDITVHDDEFRKVVEDLQELPGQKLFQFVDADGDRHQVTSSDVNAYLRETMGEDFTAKSFRHLARQRPGVRRAGIGQGRADHQGGGRNRGGGIGQYGGRDAQFLHPPGGHRPDRAAGGLARDAETAAHRKVPIARGTRAYRIAGGLARSNGCCCGITRFRYTDRPHENIGPRHDHDP